MNYKSVLQKMVAGVCVAMVLGSVGAVKANDYKDEMRAQRIRQEAEVNHLQLLSLEDVKMQVAKIVKADVSAIYFEDIELKKKKGRIVYSVEAHYNASEYDIVIDAVTGEVLKTEID